MSLQMFCIILQMLHPSLWSVFLKPCWTWHTAVISPLLKPSWPFPGWRQSRGGSCTLEASWAVNLVFRCIFCSAKAWIVGCSQSYQVSHRCNAFIPFSFILHNVCIWGQRGGALVASQQKGPGFKPSSGWSLIVECACSLEVLGLPPMRLGSF